jgi:hypothetical protein
MKIPAYFVAPIATAAILFGAGAGIAQATEITTQAGSEVDHMTSNSSHEGTTASAEDHMSVQRNDGNIEMPRVKHVWLKNGPLDVFGQPTWVLNVIDYDGVPDAEIVHN